jgi:hypothetical protein
VSFEASSPDPAVPELAVHDFDHPENSDDNLVKPDLTEVSRLIGAAVGIIMVHRGLSYAEAGGLLRDLSRQHRRGLDDLARDLVESGWSRPPRLGPGPDETRPAAKPLSRHAGESMAAQILDLLIETPDLADVLGAITDLAVDAVPGCACASITLIEEGVPMTVAASDARALDVDQPQYSHGQGPCVQAARTDTIVRIDDLAHAVPQPEPWRAAAISAGVTATLSLPIAAGPSIAASLNLYSSSDTGWPPQVQDAAEALAAYTGDAMILSTRLTEYAPPRVSALTPLRRNSSPG